MPRASTKPSVSEALTRDAEALHVALSNLVRLYQFRDRDKICCYDISVTQCYALEVLAERGPSRSQALAEALMLDKSTTTRVVDALARKGYVERLPDPEDARAVSLRVTREGRKLYERINSELIEQQVDLLRDLDPEVRAGATEIIQRLARAAQSRFVSGVSVGSCAPSCGTDDGGKCR
ncbi:MAG TPA: MarR family transcriptional regulator [Lysobacter sp.]|nr:MarR family transcriptional regulator [Lysobacter sp.]